MLDNSKILEREFNTLKDELIEAYDRKGMRASGRFAEELEVRVQTNLGTMLGAEHTQQLEYGRRAGKFPPIKVIEQWIYDKGLDTRIDNEITVKSLAFLIARKISKEGWNRDGDVNLVSEVVTEKRIEVIIERVGDHAALSITSDIIELIQELNVN